MLALGLDSEFFVAVSAVLWCRPCCGAHSSIDETSLSVHHSHEVIWLLMCMRSALPAMDTWVADSNLKRVMSHLKCGELRLNWTYSQAALSSSQIDSDLNIIPVSCDCDESVICGL